MSTVTPGQGPAGCTSTSGADAMTDGSQSGPVLYMVRAGWQVAHVVRFEQEVALCGRAMPDRFVTLRSSTTPAGTELCGECLSARQGWAAPNQ